jgi:membrane fusion protein, heavy metal efflux system
MKRMKAIVGSLIVLCSLIAACEKSPDGAGKGATPQAGAGARCPHEIKPEKCPFCTPGLVESDGFCGEHGVAEALCAACRPYLKVAFRAKGDWCAKHDAPDSQCVACHPELKEKMKPGSGHGAAATNPPAPSAGGNCEHTIALTKCPFCTPGLIQSEGFCKEHGVAEALCVKCRPFLEAAFKAKGDWCQEHTTPKSQCAACNPELLTKPKGQG